jgi:hypothetical protein
MFLPLLAVLMPVYLLARRLAPLIVAHWPMHLTVAIMTRTR